MTQETWSAVANAVPDHHVQVTVYSEQTNERIATVFGSQANVSLVTAAPALLYAAREALGALYDYYDESGDTNIVRDLQDAINQATNA